MELELFQNFGIFSDRSENLERALNHLTTSPIFKGLPPMLLFWFLWFQPNDQQKQVRNRLLATIIAALVAMVSGRLFATILPFRMRPKFDPLIVELDQEALNASLLEWSSFPSDHAILFFTIATCLFMINRFVGSLALAHAAFVVSLPRVLLGLHWPTDILAGACIGIGLAVLLMNRISRGLAKVESLDTLLRIEHLIYPLMFFVTFQMTTMFSSLRRFLSALVKTIVMLTGS